MSILTEVSPRSRHVKSFIVLLLLALVLFLLQYHQANMKILTKSLVGKNIKSHEYFPACQQIIAGDQRVIKKAQKTMRRWQKLHLSPRDYIKLSNSCENFISNREYILTPLSKREEEFPIAFSIIIYTDIEQFERLLRAIYRPQNYYCIHVDKKSPGVFQRAVQHISSCFSNVFVTSNSISVTWGEFSVLKSDLICMQDLWTRSKSWKYFINLTGQEFPLKTNNELVDILQKLKGKSIVKGVTPTKNSSTMKRYLYIHRGLKRTNKLKQQFRHNFTFYKGSTHVVLSRAFVNFTLHDQVAKDFLKWVEDTKIPDETYHPSLYKNMGFDKDLRNNSYVPPKVRYKNWRSVCYGKKVRKICINGIGDLNGITKNRALFVNKFHLNYQYLALDCLEEWFYNRTLSYYTSQAVI